MELVKTLRFGCDGTPETRCRGIPSRRGVNLSNFLRFIQWQEIWGASDCAIERIMQQSKQKAIEEAKDLKILSGNDFLRRFRRLPNKAPGPDGWTVQVLKALPPQACDWIAEVLPPGGSVGRGAGPVDGVPGGLDGQEATN